jgi:hypothetical protein
VLAKNVNGPSPSGRHLCSVTFHFYLRGPASACSGLANPAVTHRLRAVSNVKGRGANFTRDSPRLWLSSKRRLGQSRTVRSLFCLERDAIHASER